MSQFAWNKEFETGMALLDEHYIRLVGDIHSMAACLEEDHGEGGLRFNTVLNQILDQSSRHFATEECEMREIGIDAIHVSLHIVEHHRFTTQLNNIWSARYSIPSPSKVLLEYALAWLHFHLIEFDFSLARQISLIQKGATQEDVCAQESVLSQHPTLSAASRKLLFAQGELGEYLAKSNQLLEARVLERTRELESVNQRLELLSRMDGLLSIPNRVFFDDRLKSEWRLTRRNKQPITLMLIDVDYLRQYNETYGHLEGDQCLRAVARAAKESLYRPGDAVCRFDSDAFAFLLPDTTAEGADIVATRLMERLSKMAIPHASSPIEMQVTVSVGIATMEPALGGEALGIVIQAEDALGVSKSKGRNQISVYRPTSHLSLAKA